MSVPASDRFFTLPLRAMSDGKIYPMKELRDVIVANSKLSDEDLGEMLPSLAKAKLIEKISFGNIQ